MAEEITPMSVEHLRRLMAEDDGRAAWSMQRPQELNGRRRLTDLMVVYNERVRPKDHKPITEADIVQVLCSRMGAAGLG